MLSAFGVDHGEISKIAIKPTGKLFKLPKAGAVFGRAGKQQAGPSKSYQAGQAAGKGARAAFSAVGTAAGKTASGLGFQRLGQSMQAKPVKAGVTTSFLAGGAAAYGVNQQKKRQQPGQVG